MRLISPILLLIVQGCQTSPSGPTAAPPPLPPDAALLLSPATADGGRRLYVNKCARCHKFYDPAQYSDADWDSWMTKMSRKAKLKPEQTAMLGEYLAAFRMSATSSNTAVNPP